MAELEHEPAVTIKVYPDGRVDTANAAKYLTLSRQTLARLRSEGTSPPFVRIHGRIFYYLEDLQAYLASFPRVRSAAAARQKG